MTTPLLHAGLIAVVALAGCAKQIAPEVIANADYGPPPPADHQQIIKDTFTPLLIDPTSPLYTFSEPSKGYTKESSIQKTQQTFGWRVCGTLNSKNRMGGYAGSVPFFVLFRDGKIAYHLLGEIVTDKYGISFNNAAIRNACNRDVK